MTKRRVERDIDELTEEVLRGLTPEERLQLMLIAMKRGETEWATSLRETAPTGTYRQTDPRYVDRVNKAMMIGHSAMYHLGTRWYRFELYDRQYLRVIEERLNNDDPTEEEIDSAQQRVNDLDWAYQSLYVYYHSYERFAETVLGVSLATWLGFHSESEEILAAVEEVLDRDSIQTRIEEEVGEDVLAEAIDENVEGLIDDWEQLLGHLRGL